MDGRRQQAQELRRQIEWTLARAIDPSDVLPMLHRLARVAGDGTDESAFANLHLAELLVERDPWRAALCARRVVIHRGGDDRGWATLGLCQTLLGHYRFAVSAYHRALAAAPSNPWYAHNLGHLLDVALGRAGDAIQWLRRAHEAAPQSGEVAASFAHALARAGELAEAKRVLTRAMKRGGSSREHAAMLKWLEQGAPSDKDHPLPRPAPVHALGVRREGPALSPSAPSRDVRRRDDRPAGGRHDARHGGHTAVGSRRPWRGPTGAELEAMLARGAASLPLDAKQRARARSLARDAAEVFARGPSARPSASRGAIDAAAAAVAYAIVYVDHVPLTQAEVAACFRVGVASLRARFAELRAHLDLTPGDTRYATQRRR